MSTPIPVQTYYIPVREDDTMIPGDTQGSSEIGRGDGDQNLDTYSLVSFGVAAAGTVIYYDHWEDGYDLNLTDPTNRQSTTLVFGDGDLSNNYDANGNLVLPAGSDDLFEGGEAFNLSDTVAVDRTASDILFDGSDKISATFPIAVSRLTAPQKDDGTVVSIATGAVEVQDTSKYGSQYIIPVGGDGSGNTDAPTGAFDLAFAHVMAASPNTPVYLNGTLVATLNTGETYVASVVEGDKITTFPDGESDGNGVQVTLVTRDDGREYNEQRWYSLTPVEDWSNDYVTPVGTDTSFDSDEGLTAIWVFNPNDDAITVTVNTRDPDDGSIDTATLTVPAGESVKTDDIPGGSGARLTSVGGETFYALTQTETVGSGARSDWGHPLIPVEQLTSQGLITFGFGNTDQLTGGDSGSSRSLTFVTPLEDAQINVDFDGDGTVDQVVIADALQSITFSDTDDNMTGALIYAHKVGDPTTPVDVAIAHGQNPAVNATESQSIDAGVVTVPLPEVFTSKFSALSEDADGNGVVSPGDTITFTISTLNFGRVEIGEGGYVVEDFGLPMFDTIDYVAGSTTFNLSDGRGEIALEDSASGTAFPVDDGFSTLGRGAQGDADSAILNVGETHTITFKGVVKDFDQLDPGTVAFLNEGQLTNNNGGLLNEFSSSGPIVFDSGVVVEKTTNGEDADTGTGPVVQTGAPVTWVYTVTNTGETFLADVSVADDDPNVTPVYQSGDDNDNGVIDPNEAWVYTASGNAQSGQYNNVATVTATPVYADGTTAVPTVAGGGAVTDDDPSAYFGANPSIAFDKVVVDVGGQGPDAAITAAGQVITYQLVVTNDGNVTLNNVVVNDPLTGTSETIPSLAPNASAFVDATYTVTQADIDANGGGDGDIDNIATADSDETGPVDDEEAVDIARTADISIVKEADKTLVTDAGETVTYTFTVKNDGNVTLTDVVLTDDNFTPGDTGDDFAPTFVSGDDNGNDKLDVGETWTYSASTTISQGEIDAGEALVNTATVESNETGPQSDDATVAVGQTPTIAIDKVVVDVDGRGAAAAVTAAGQVIAYDLIVTNTGNQTLTNVTVDDPLTGTSEVIPSLAPNASTTVQATYTVTQADIDDNGGGDGDIDNTATADSDETGPVSDDEEVEIARDPAMIITKDADKTTVSAAGETVNYTFTVKNAGNVTLTNVTLSDDNFTPGDTGDDFAPTLVSGDDNGNDNLDVGETWTYTASATITQGQIDAGENLVNTATADSDETDPVDDDETVTINAAPGLAIEKVVTGVDTAGNGTLDEAGDVIDYTITVTNTGAQTLTGVTVEDPLTNLSETIASLAPGESASFDVSYAITQADLDDNGGGDGDIDNVATADSNETGPEEDTTETPLDRDPTISILKTADKTLVTRAGETVTFTFTVKNEGNVALTGVTVVDDNFTPGDTGDDFAPTYVSGDANDNDKLDVGESWVYSAAHDVTADDLLAGQMENTATADSNETGPVSDTEVVRTEVIEKCTDVADEFGKVRRKDATIDLSKDGQQPNGTNGDDVIFGTGKGEAISTNEGENKVKALGGHDIVNGGNSGDLVYGNGGKDIINGNGGDDSLSGDGGHDKIYGGGGNDIIMAGNGNDLVEAGGGNDRINLGNGNDTVQGEGGDDCIAGGTDKGRIKGAGDNVEVRLGDELFGNGGADQFEYEAGDGVDFLFDFNANDGDTLRLFGIDEGDAKFVTGSTPYGPAAGIVFNLDDDKAFEGGIFFQQVRDPDDLRDLVEKGAIDFV
ncbi:MAG: hypothetical protein ROR55_16560 [Devosia sp.]